MAKKTTKKKKVTTKLSKPSVSLARNGYKFTLSFSNIHDLADYIYIERWIYEAQDTKKSSNKAKEYKKVKLGAKKNSSWSYTIEKEKYYPFVADGTDSNPKQSDYDQRIKKIVFKVWTEGKNENKKNIKSESVTKTYAFTNSVNPKVALAYNEDGTSFTFAVDINDDYGIDDNTKKVATRAWGWLTSQVKGGKEKKVSGYTGQWYNRDTAKEVRKKITTSISPSTPVKYIAHAYSAGPGGKSETKTATHIFAIPKAPAAPKIERTNALKKSNVDNGYGIYQVNWDIDTGNGWYPVDTVTIQYRDQNQYKGASDIYGENMGSWSEAKGNIHSSIKKIQTNELGAVSDDNVRYFRILAEHDGNVTPGYVTGVVAYGKPSGVSGISASTQTVDKKEVLVFSWSKPSTELYGTDPTTKLYNGGTLGKGGRARIVIFKNSTSTTPIKTIYYGDDEWNNNKWVYTIPEKDKGKSIDYCFQVRVGLDNLNPGGRSDNVWCRNIIVPEKCKNVTGTKLANNTTVELTWENPVSTDTIFNGVEIAWSTMPNAWESNSAPSTTKFDNGAMTKAYITGLTSGEIYYFWIRLYEEKDGSTNYGLWSDPSPGILMSNKPDTPVLTLSRSWVKEGGKISAQWVYYASGNMPQTNAQIEMTKDGQSWGAIVNVDGEEDKCAIDLSKKVNGKYLYPAGDYYLRVVVANELGEATSDQIEFKIATNPTCSISSSSIVDYSYTTEIDDTGTTETTTVKSLRTLPFNVTVAGNGDLNLYVYCIDNFRWVHPDKSNDIFQGDCVWTSQIEAGNYSIENISLADNARYRIQLECVDPDTLLTAEPQYIDFEVHWKHQAIEPNDSTVTIDDETCIAELVPVKPEGALDTDVCDIYRTTADGRYLCYKNAPWGKIIIDNLPTFGDAIEPSYCFCTRTADGDEAWCDMVYELGGSGIIINYDNEILKLPWNVSIDDSRSKQGELRSHLGGTKTYYGQPFIDRSQSLNTEVVKIDDEELVERLYELSRYTELCYVRTSNCLGYPAIVDVSISREYNNQIVSVSLSAKEADADDEFLGRTPDEETT